MRKLHSTRKLLSRAGKIEKNKTRLRRHILNICIITVCAGLVAFGVWRIFIFESEDSAALQEYQELREVFFTVPEPPEPQEPPQPQKPPELLEQSPEDFENNIEEDEYLNLAELARINPDFVGWISIENYIEYPVVRGVNNDIYIHTTFSGGQNSAGAIFMDFRNRAGFDDSITILFGHRARNGTMFAPLVKYLDRSFLQENPKIVITTRDGEVLTYRVFSSKLTDAWDTLYDLSFSNSSQAAGAFPNAPADTNRFLLLSTCTPNSDKDERIIVFAALETTP